MSPAEQVDALRNVLRAMDADAALIALWVDAPCVPPRAHVLHAVFAYPALRLATLRHWRDTLEAEVGGTPFVAHEASKWARLLLKGHGGTQAICCQPTVHQEAGLASMLADVARRIDGDDVAAWRAAAGWAPLPAQDASLTTGAERFNALEGWLVSVRQALDGGIKPARDPALVSPR